MASTHDDTASAPSPAAPKPAPPRHASHWLVATVVGVVLLAAGAVATAMWALKSATGSAWLLAQVPGLQVTNPRGALLGDFSADHLALQLPGTGRLQIDELGWRGLELGRAAEGLRLRLAIADLHARRVAFEPEARPTAPKTSPKPPTRLELPLEVDIAALRVGELAVGGAAATPLRNVSASVHLGADDGTVHRIDKLGFAWSDIGVSGSAQVASAAPLQLDAHLDAKRDAGGGLPAWNAVASAVGPLAAPLVEVTVRVPAADRRQPQSLDVHGTLHPFATWPLADVDLTLKNLDLSTFAASLPATSLSGAASARGTGVDQPSSLTLRLANAAAGRWDEARLPVRSVQAELRARPADLTHIDIPSFAVDLGGVATAAGRVTGSGIWTPQRWHLDTELTDVETARLDRRAPALALGGSLAVGAADVDPNAARRGPIDVKAALQGRLGDRGSARPVSLDLDASASPTHIDVRRAALRAGAASASIKGSAAEASAGAPWQIDADVALADFDPTDWFAVPTGSPWRNGPHRLNAKGRLDIAMPPSIATMAPYDAVAAVIGNADLTVAKSVLAGVPLAGELSWRHPERTAPRLHLALDLGANHVSVDGRVGLDSSGTADLWDTHIAAPALSRLAPLWRLARPGDVAGIPAGSLDATAQVGGRWPRLATNGRLDASHLRFGPAHVQKAAARWQLGTTPGAPLALDATLDRATWTGAMGSDTSPNPARQNGPEIESLRLQVNGSEQAHRIDLRAVSNLLPPAWTDALQAAATPSAAAASAAARQAGDSSREAQPPQLARSVVVLHAEGGLAGTAADAFSGWRGKIGRIEVRSSNVGTSPWLEAREIVLDAGWADGPLRLSMQPGRIDVLGAGLRWSRFAFRAAAPQRPMQIDLAAELDPLPIAPLLRQLQPTFGWGGNLMIGGHFNVRTTDRVTADIVVERRSGDLSVTEETRTETLGLTDLRVGLDAHDGVWNATLALAGKTLGVGSGAVVARTGAGVLWPNGETPIDGVLELRVADLGTLGTWVPAGWRIGGALHASTRIGGRIGAPEYTGELTGTGLGVRNFLEGIDIHDGELKVALQGPTARIERFIAHAGDGTLSAGGTASFGATPQARLQISAQKFQLLGRVDRRIVASGDARLRLDGNDAALDGGFTIDEGLIDISRGNAPTLASDVHVIRDVSGPLPPPGSAESIRLALKTAGVKAPRATNTTPARQVSLDVSVDMGKQLRIRGHGLDSLLAGKLHITAPEGQLAINGTISTVNGTFASYGQNLQIDRGLIIFTGSLDNPRLDIEATRPKLDVRVGVAVSGTAQNPRVRLFSEPDMSDVDKLSWLVLGRASDGLGNADTALLQRAAMALLAGEGGGGPGMTDRIIKSLGLDELSFSQGTVGDFSTTVVTLGKQISNRWFVGYERGLNATTGSWQLIYRIARRFTLRAQTGDDNAIDLIWTWRWR